MQQVSETSEQTRTTFARPQLIFFTELAGHTLQHLLVSEGLLEECAAQQYGIALSMLDLSEGQAAVVRQLNACGVTTVAWLLLPPDEGGWFNLQNYPQAVERYRTFRAWAQLHQLCFDAVGLDIEPPAGTMPRLRQWEPAYIIRRLWLARENVLYPAARAAYTDLISEIHNDGYAVHTYQLPFLADDRRAGTTLIQQALDIVDLPSDVEVLICPSRLPIRFPNQDHGGALITSYGPDADSIGIVMSSRARVKRAACPDEAVLSQPLEALCRDLLLAARYTDIIYIFSLEGCVERHLLPCLANLDWSRDTRALLHQRMLVGLLRVGLLGLLLLARFGRGVLAWLGWGLAALLLLQQIRQWWRVRAGGVPKPNRSHLEDL